jgi:GT2 family glycosyltransferase
MLQTLRLLLARNIRGFKYRFARLYDSLNEPTYETWLALVGTQDNEGNFSSALGAQPLVLLSIVGDTRSSGATRRSITGQSYSNIRETSVEQVIAMTSEATAPYFWMRVPAGVQLEEKAIERLIQPLLMDADVAAVYCDEDRIDEKGARSKPFFKPAWNPPLAETGWLAPDCAIVRLSALGNNIQLEEASSGELLLKAAEHGKIMHLPRVLFHRPAPRAPVSASAPKCPVTKTNVSVVIPTRDRADLLKTCLNGLFDETRYDDLDVIVVDNDSREAETLALFERYEAAGLISRVCLPGPFNFSRACNLGVASARHELILLLNNDIEPLGSEWLDQLVAELDNPGIGAAGALLLFPDGFIQHAGVTLGSGSVARHSFQFHKLGAGDDLGLMSQRQEMSAVTAACLLTRRSLWKTVGGMDEGHLSVAFNDVDYCLKLREIGKGVMWTPHARLLHYESVSRGRDNTPEKLARFAAEEAYMHQRWGKALANDPFYNPNLSLIVGDHGLAVQPRSLLPRIGSLPPSAADMEAMAYRS